MEIRGHTSLKSPPQFSKTKAELLGFTSLFHPLNFICMQKYIDFSLEFTQSEHPVISNTLNDNSKPSQLVHFVFHFIKADHHPETRTLNSTLSDRERKISASNL